MSNPNLNPNQCRLNCQPDSCQESARNFQWLAILVISGWLMIVGVGCKFVGHRKFADRFQPANDLNWAPDMKVLPFAEIEGSEYRLHNIRSNQYLTHSDFVVDYHDRVIDLSQVQSVDFITVPFGPKSSLAHTMVSFGLDDGTFLGLSVEVRRHVGDTYRALAGLTRGYDLIYVLGEERDLIGVRTEHYDADVYLYPSTATPEVAQAFFADMIDRMNKLERDPEFYNLITNNCTTNLKDHVNQLSPNRIREKAWQVLLPGFSARYAHEIGLIENRIPFEDLESLCLVNDLAKGNQDDPDFSSQIRSRRYRIDREIARQSQRAPLFAGRGSAYLESRKVNAPTSGWPDIESERYGEKQVRLPGRNLGSARTH